MPDDRPFTLQVMHAVAESSLPSDLRHFVHVHALLANSATGSAFYGQPKIARAMGCSERQVRRLYQRLEDVTDAPVQIVRRRRGTPDGRGRSSDEWQLRLVPIQAHRTAGAPSASPEEPSSTGQLGPLETTSTGQAGPVEQEPAQGDQADIHDSSSGHPRQLKRTDLSDDRRSDRRSNRRSTSTSPSSAGSMAYQLTSPEADPEPQKGKSRKARSGQATKGNGKAAPAENGVEHQATIDHYHQVFLACRNVAPIIDGREGSSVKSLLKKLKGNGPEARRRIDIAFASFRKNTVTIHVIAKDPDAFATAEAPRSNGRARPQQCDDDSINEVMRRHAEGTL